MCLINMTTKDIVKRQRQYDNHCDGAHERANFHHNLFGDRAGDSVDVLRGHRAPPFIAMKLQPLVIRLVTRPHSSHAPLPLK